jgi:hypothetical protein
MRAEVIDRRNAIIFYRVSMRLQQQADMLSLSWESDACLRVYRIIGSTGAEFFEASCMGDL